jgi:hypothetical protein
MTKKPNPKKLKQERIDYIKNQIDAIEKRMIAGGGVSSKSIDGVSVSYDNTTQIRTLNYWRRELAELLSADGFDPLQKNISFQNILG